MSIIFSSEFSQQPLLYISIYIFSSAEFMDDASIDFEQEDNHLEEERGRLYRLCWFVIQKGWF